MEIKQFSDVYGHKEIIGHLQTAVRTGEVSHAYLFDGEGGSGKRTLAQIFAMLLFGGRRIFMRSVPSPAATAPPASRYREGITRISFS